MRLSPFEMLREELAEVYARAGDERGALPGWRPYPGGVGAWKIGEPAPKAVFAQARKDGSWKAWPPAPGCDWRSTHEGAADTIRGAMRAAEACLREHGWTPTRADHDKPVDIGNDAH